MICWCVPCAILPMFTNLCHNCGRRKLDESARNAVIITRSRQSPTYIHTTYILYIHIYIHTYTHVPFKLTIKLIYL